jgi:hypothetical protein
MLNIARHMTLSRDGLGRLSLYLFHDGTALTCARPLGKAPASRQHSKDLNGSLETVALMQHETWTSALSKFKLKALDWEFSKELFT